MSMHIAIRLDHGTTIARSPEVARRIAAAITRPELSILSRVSARKLDRWSKHTPATPESIERYLLDLENDSVALDNGRAGELTATAEIESGINANLKASPLVRYMAYIAVPLESAQFEGVLGAAFDVATAVSATAGFVTTEPTYGLAHRTAIGHSIPMERPGLSDQRIRERRVRDFKNEQLDTRLAGVEWGTFVGAGARRALDLDAVRASGAFYRIVELSPSLAFLQLTAHPEDDLSPAIEVRLAQARAVLAPLLLDTSDLPQLPDPSF